MRQVDPFRSARRAQLRRLRRAGARSRPPRTPTACAAPRSAGRGRRSPRRTRRRRPATAVRPPRRRPSNVRSAGLVPELVDQQRHRGRIGGRVDGSPPRARRAAAPGRAPSAAPRARCRGRRRPREGRRSCRTPQTCATASSLTRAATVVAIRAVATPVPVDVACRRAEHHARRGARGEHPWRAAVGERALVEVGPAVARADQLVGQQPCADRRHGAQREHDVVAGHRRAVGQLDALAVSPRGSPVPRCTVSLPSASRLAQQRAELEHHRRPPLAAPSARAGRPTAPGAAGCRSGPGPRRGRTRRSRRSTGTARRPRAAPSPPWRRVSSALWIRCAAVNPAPTTTSAVGAGGHRLVPVADPDRSWPAPPRRAARPGVPRRDTARPGRPRSGSRRHAQRPGRHPARPSGPRPARAARSPRGSPRCAGSRPRTRRPAPPTGARPGTSGSRGAPPGSAATSACARSHAARSPGSPRRRDGARRANAGPAGRAGRPGRGTAPPAGPSRSSSTTSCTPRCHSAAATARPAGPAPTITTSALVRRARPPARGAPAAGSAASPGAGASRGGGDAGRRWSPDDRDRHDHLDGRPLRHAVGDHPLQRVLGLSALSEETGL